MPLTPREVFDRYVHHGFSHDGEAQAALFAADGVLEFPFAPPGVPRRTEGREQIRDLLLKIHVRTGRAETALGDPGDTRLVWHETTDPEVYVAEIDTRITTVDGFLDASLVQIFRFRAGQILSLRDYWDGATDEFKAWMAE